MKLTTGELAAFVNGTLDGDASIEITRLASIEDGAPGTLSFLYNPRYQAHIYNSNSSAVIVAIDFIPDKPLKSALIRVANPYFSFNSILSTYFNHEEPRLGIEPQTFVHETAVVGRKVYLGRGSYISAGCEVGEGVQLYPNVFLGDNVKIGKGSLLYPNVTVYKGCVIGQNCIIHAGTVIGADGFGFIQDKDGYVKIPHVGNVVLEDDVEIGCNSCIDRATIGSTRIMRGVKIDNLVQVAHNTEIGDGSVIAAQTGISGSSKLGKGVQIGGQVGITGHIQVADYTQVAAKSGISKNILVKGKAYRGSPARELRQQLRSEALQLRMPELLARIEVLEEMAIGFQEGLAVKKLKIKEPKTGDKEAKATKEAEPRPTSKKKK